MAQFYFHVRKDRTVFEDARGGEFTDLLSAWNWAIDDVRKLIEDGDVQGSIEQHWMEICDATGATVASLPFARVSRLH